MKTKMDIKDKEKGALRFDLLIGLKQEFLQSFHILLNRQATPYYLFHRF